MYVLFNTQWEEFEEAFKDYDQLHNMYFKSTMHLPKTHLLYAEIDDKGMIVRQGHIFELKDGEHNE